MSSIRAGVVVTIRVNPRNCQSVLDLMDVLEQKPDGQSFSSFVSLALASLIESSIDSGFITEPDPFQYMNRMRPYLGRKRGANVKKLTNTVNAQGSRFRPPVMPKRELTSVEVTTEQALHRKEAMKMMQDLAVKYKASVDNTEIQWSSADQSQWEEVFLTLFPGEPMMQPSQVASE